MLLNLSRAWACSLVLGFAGLVVAGTTKNAAHWRGPWVLVWLVVVIAVAAGLGAGVGTSRPFSPWLPLLLTVSLPMPLVWVVLGMLVRADHGFDISFLGVLSLLVLTGLCASGAAVGVWVLRRRLSGQPWKTATAIGPPGATGAFTDPTTRN